VDKVVHNDLIPTPHQARRCGLCELVKKASKSIFYIFDQQVAVFLAIEPEDATTNRRAA
jgi:hypothetical protein